MKTSLLLIFCSLSLLTLYGQNIPIDFEDPGNGADWTWTVFENDTNPALEIVDNPDISGINTSSTVARFTALQAGQPFAGCESMHGADIGTFTIDQESSVIRIMVWKSVISDVGIKLVRDDGWSLGEIKIANTLTDEWEQLVYDFSAHIGNTYDQIVIFPDFDNRTSDNVIYFDNIYGDLAGSTSINDIENTTIEISPNPAADDLSIRSDDFIERYKIYSLTGQLIKHEEVNGYDSIIDISTLDIGMYILKASIDGQTLIQKFIKN